MASKSPYRSLNRRADFLNLKAAGHAVHINSWLLFNFRKSDSPGLRCGWTIPGHIGPAVLRNRFKRWGREFFRKWAKSSALRGGLDLNVVLKRKGSDFYLSLSHKEFDEALVKGTNRISRA